MNRKRLHPVKSGTNFAWLNHVRLFWRTRLRSQWRSYQWLVVGSVGIVSVIFGCVGFAKHFQAMREPRSFFDVLYLTLQLVPMNSGAILPPIPSELEIARFLIPALTAYAVIQALAVLFSRQMQGIYLHLQHQHVVICGLGRKGYLLTQHFLEDGLPVVIVESDGGNHFLESCRDLGALTLLGDATDQVLLRQAGVARAKYLIADTGDDGVNAQVAVHARALTTSRRGTPLACVVHIVDPQLCDLLRERELDTAPGFRLGFFNIFDMGARAVLNAYPPGDSKGVATHIVIIGFGSMGQSLVVRAARDWRAKHPPDDPRLRITVVDRQALDKVDALNMRFPKLRDACELVPVQKDIRGSYYQQAEFLFDAQGRCSASAVYVCFDNDILSLSAGLIVLQHLRCEDVPILIRVAQNAGLAMLLRGRDGDDLFENLHTFALLDRTCRPELVLGGTHEILAQAIHEAYVHAQRAAGESLQINPSLAPWEELPEDLRESNRRQADHIGRQLRDLGYRVAPLTDWDADLLEFTPNEIEAMARAEHERFVQERLEAGWTPGVKNLVRKTNPSLAPWADLSLPEKEKDRATVRRLPGFLAQAGLQVYRPSPRYNENPLTATVPEVEGIEDTFSERLNAEVN